LRCLSRFAASLSGIDTPDRVVVEAVTANYFSVIGIRPLVAEDSCRGGPCRQPGRRLSATLWRRSFGADPAIVGRAVKHQDRLYTVVGVAPRGFQGTQRGSASDLWVPASMSEQIIAVGRRSQAARQPRPERLPPLRPAPGGVSREQAQADVTLISARNSWSLRRERVFLTRAQRLYLSKARERSREHGRNSSVGHRSSDGRGGYPAVDSLRNVANLLLARGTVRKREIGMRLPSGHAAPESCGSCLPRVFSCRASALWSVFALAVAATHALSRLELPAKMLRRWTLHQMPTFFCSRCAVGHRRTHCSGCCPGCARRGSARWMH